MKKAVSIFLASLISTSSLTYVNAQANETELTENQHLVTKEGGQQTEKHLSHEGHHSGALVSAKDALKALLADMKQYRATFNQTVVDAQQNVVHEAQGVLTMTRPNKLRWETTFPDETLLIADGEAVWNVDTFVEQVTVLSQESAIKDNPIVLLTASDNATWKKFSITELNVSAENEALRSFQVTPNEAGGQIETLTLTFNSLGNLAALNMLDTQQQISTLVFDNVETRFMLAADTFEVDVPDSFIVDDQR